MKNVTKKQAYESPETEIVLLTLEQCIAISDMGKNDFYEEDFNS